MFSPKVAKNNIKGNTGLIKRLLQSSQVKNINTEVNNTYIIENNLTHFTCCDTLTNNPAIAKGYNRV
ncbi:MAG: hypothetical protein IPJ81_01765 [Chitinophagaceae bacterium]|nr:hypothetical protein [Chitinophagaceae bacterium]